MTVLNSWDAAVREHDPSSNQAVGLFEGVQTAYKQLQPTRFEDLFVLAPKKVL